MRNPLRSEAEAFRFLLLTIGYFALIAIGALIDKWVGIGVFIVLSLVVLYVAFLRGRDEPPPRVAPTLQHDPNERRILVIANETVAGETLHSMIREKRRGLPHERARRRAGAAVAVAALRVRRRSGP